MAPGERGMVGALMFEPEVFRNQMYCIEKLLEILLGLFGATRGAARIFLRGG